MFTSCILSTVFLVSRFSWALLIVKEYNLGEMFCMVNSDSVKGFKEVAYGEEKWTNLLSSALGIIS